MTHFRRWFCRHFGHTAHDIDRVMFALKTGAIWRNSDAVLTCSRCHAEIVRVRPDGTVEARP